MNLEFIKPQNLGSLLMKSSQSNFNLRSPSSYLARSYLIATVQVSRKGSETSETLAVAAVPDLKNSHEKWRLVSIAKKTPN